MCKIGHDGERDAKVMLTCYRRPEVHDLWTKRADRGSESRKYHDNYGPCGRC